MTQHHLLPLLLLTATPALAQQPTASPTAVVEPVAAAPSTHAPSQMHARSVGLALGGVGVLLLGAGTGIGGVFVAIWSGVRSCSANGWCTTPATWLLGVAIPMEVLAVSAVIGGFAMIVVGANPVPNKKVSIGPGGLRIVW